MMIFGFMFPVLFIIWLVLQEPKYRYMQRHYADEKHASPSNKIVGYDMIDTEIAKFEINHDDGYGYKCPMLGEYFKYVKNGLDERLPLDKREFLQANPEAAKLYKRCMTRHIAWSRGVIPIDLRRKWRKMNPYEPYYRQYGTAEKEFYSHGTTVYEKNCIRKPEDRENPYCRHCAFTQNKVAKSYLAQRLIDYNAQNVSPCGISTYPHAAARDLTVIGFNKCSDEGLDTSKWNCADRSVFERKNYDRTEIDTLDTKPNRNYIYCSTWHGDELEDVCCHVCKKCPNNYSCLNDKRNLPLAF